MIKVDVWLCLLRPPGTCHGFQEGAPTPARPGKTGQAVTIPVAHGLRIPAACLARAADTPQAYAKVGFLADFSAVFLLFLRPIFIGCKAGRDISPIRACFYVVSFF